MSMLTTKIDLGVFFFLLGVWMEWVWLVERWTCQEWEESVVGLHCIKFPNNQFKYHVRKKNGKIQVILNSSPKLHKGKNDPRNNSSKILLWFLCMLAVSWRASYALEKWAKQLEGKALVPSLNWTKRNDSWRKKEVDLPPSLLSALLANTA